MKQLQRRQSPDITDEVGEQNVAEGEGTRNNLARLRNGHICSVLFKIGDGGACQNPLGLVGWTS